MIGAAIGCTLVGFALGWALNAWVENSRPGRRLYRRIMPTVVMPARDFDLLTGHARVGAVVSGVRTRKVAGGGELLPMDATEAERVERAIDRAEGTLRHR